MKRILTATSIALLTAVLFTACGGGGGGGNNGNPQLSGTVKVEGGSNQKQ